MRPLSSYRHSVLVLILMLITLLGSLPGLSGLQVIDRDEARYAQASVQMRDSGDYVNIRFHDRDRHKKPAGIYWLQTASLNLFSSPEKRDIWVHRLPSVLAGLLAVIGLYWAGLTIYGRKGAFIAALLLSTSFLLIFESHIAKTDAALCAASVWTLGALLKLRDPQYSAAHPQIGIILWVALGCGVILKGPILPAIALTTLITLFVWERQHETIRPSWRVFFSPLGLCCFGLLVLPWYIMIAKATDGAFLTTAVTSDLAPKLTGGQEKHGGLPGYYVLTIFVTFWPAALFLLSGFAYGFKALKTTPKTDLKTDLKTDQHKPLVSDKARFLLAWIIPFWIILELTPTKLPHYILPLFPAIALLIAGAIMDMSAYKNYRKTRSIGALIFFIVSAALAFVVAGGEALYGNDHIWVYVVAVVILLLALCTTVWVFQGHIKRGVTGMILTGLGLSIPTYAHVMPQLDRLRIAPKIATTIEAHNLKLPRNGGALIRSPHFTEPSLIYYLGDNVLLGDKANDYDRYPAQSEHIWIIDEEKSESDALLTALTNLATYNEKCLSSLGSVSGLNYSKGDDVDLQIYTIKDC